MRRLTALVLFLLMSVGLGSVGHATEGANCIEAAASSLTGHDAGDLDDVPADLDKAFPHHHGGCHGHHVGVPSAWTPITSRRVLRLKPASWDHRAHALTLSDAALRPPKA